MTADGFRIVIARGYGYTVGIEKRRRTMLYVGIAYIAGAELVASRCFLNRLDYSGSPSTP